MNGSVERRRKRAVRMCEACRRRWRTERAVQRGIVKQCLCHLRDEEEQVERNEAMRRLGGEGGRMG